MKICSFFIIFKPTFTLFSICDILKASILGLKLGDSSMSKATEKAKKRREKILEFMKMSVKKKGYAPTVREICTALSIKSTSTVHKDIETLVKEGYLIKDPAKPRAIAFTEQLKQNSEKPTSSKFNDVEGLEDYDLETVGIPVVGDVAAGEPITSIENIEDYIPIPSRYVDSNSFMLRVRGDSMINAGILNGDLVIVTPQETARNGEIVVAMVESLEYASTVKRFFKENGRYRLQPENDSMSPIYVDDLQIIGKVTGVFRYNVN